MVTLDTPSTVRTGTGIRSRREDRRATRRPVSRMTTMIGPVLLFFPAAWGVAETGSSPLLLAAREELARSMKKLKDQPVPPYYLSYEVTETHTIEAVGSFGSLTRSEEKRARQLDIDLRVGDYKLDNTHSIRGGFGLLDFLDRFSYIDIPMENDPAAIKSVLWYHTDRKYKRAVERLTKVKTNVQVKVEEEDQSADFSREEAQKYLEPLARLSVDQEAWEQKVRRYTAPFAAYADIYSAEATLRATGQAQWFVNSEDAQIQTSTNRYRLMITAFTKADDGMVLPRYESFFAFTPEGLPDDATVLARVNKMIEDLLALQKAPIVDPYTGPAILSGRASGVFFHEVFGHRIEGHRQKREEEGQTFKKKVGEQLLPASFSIFFDPTQRTAGGSDLVGFYKYDNQGVKARRVPVVEKGVFKSFLMSRSPVEGFPSSNGHGRKQPGFAPVARQSNLLVQVDNAVSHGELVEQLLEQVREEGKPFGLLFDDIQGGFTITGRTIPNTFNVLPILVYRIFPDGRKELVRGVDLIGTPLTAFSKIMAADDQFGVFNGTCGAESGGVPVAAVSPGILVSQIEVQKKAKSQERRPILPAPFD